MSKVVKTIILWIPGIVWMGIIFYLSSRSTIGIGQTRTERFLILKSFHVIEYAILAVLLFFSIRNIKLSILISYVYALSDEFHQTFVPGREGKFQDTLIDLIGILLGSFIISKIFTLKAFRKYLPKLLID